MSSGRAITEVLGRVAEGDDGALDHLVQLLYGRLRKIARQQLRRERSEHTLGTTALVNEAYLRLRSDQKVPAESRTQFFAAAAQTMQRVLIDYARARKRLKRGGGQDPIPLEEVEAFLSERQADEILAIEEALQRLARIDDRASKVVIFRFFGGLSLAETAQALEVSVKTVQRTWVTARAWLRREVSMELDLPT